MQDKHKNIKDAEVVDNKNTTPEKTADAPTASDTSNPSNTPKTDTPANTNTAEKTPAKPEGAEKAGDKPDKAEDKKAPEQAATPAHTEAASESNGKPLLAFIAGVVTALVLWQLYSVVTADNTTATGEYPDPVATVNGLAIDQQLFEQNVDSTLAGLESQGVDTTDEETRRNLENQALETLINTRLLVAAATAGDYEPSTEEVDARIAELESQYGDAATLDAELERLNLTREELRADVAEQLSVDALLTNEVLPEDFTVTDEEVQEVYDGLVEAGQEMPPLESVRDAIVSQIEQQQQREVIETYLESLRSEADIEIYL